MVSCDVIGKAELTSLEQFLSNSCTLGLTGLNHGVSRVKREVRSSTSAAQQKFRFLTSEGCLLSPVSTPECVCEIAATTPKGQGCIELEGEAEQESLPALC